MTALAEAAVAEAAEEEKRQAAIRKASQPTNDVIDAYKSYYAAVQSKDGEVAASFVDKSTIALYERMRTHALRSSRDELGKLPITELIQVLVLRQKIGQEELAMMDGSAVFRRSVNEGWVHVDTVENFNSHSVMIVFGNARLKLNAEGRPPGWAYRLTRENNHWRVNLIDEIKAAETDLIERAQREGLSPTELAAHLAEGITMQPVTDAIWQPLVD